MAKIFLALLTVLALCFSVSAQPLKPIHKRVTEKSVDACRQVTWENVTRDKVDAIVSLIKQYDVLRERIAKAGSGNAEAAVTVSSARGGVIYEASGAEAIVARDALRGVLNKLLSDTVCKLHQAGVTIEDPKKNSS